MNRYATTLLVAATLCVVLHTAAYPSDTSFACPDDEALQLFDLAYSARGHVHNFKELVTTYSFVIENATRAMDEVALRIACSNLAHDSYIEDHGGVGADHFGLIPPKEAVDSLRKKTLDCVEVP